MRLIRSCKCEIEIETLDIRIKIKNRNNRNKIINRQDDNNRDKIINRDITQKTYRTPKKPTEPPKNLSKPQKTYRSPKKPTETPKNLPHPVRICKKPKNQKTQKPKNLSWLVTSNFFLFLGGGVDFSIFVEYITAVF